MGEAKRRAAAVGAPQVLALVGSNAAILSTVCQPFDFDEAAPEAQGHTFGAGWLALSMARTMMRRNGLGLAAPQLGLGLRVFVMRLAANASYRAVFNPEIVDASEDFEGSQEGCLSFPGVYTTIARPVWIAAKWSDEFGKPRAGRFEGLGARIFCHEYDHLEGRCGVGRPDDLPRNAPTGETVVEERKAPAKGLRTVTMLGGAALSLSMAHSIRTGLQAAR